MAASAAAKPAAKEENYWVTSLREDLKERFGGNNAYEKPLESIANLINLKSLDKERRDWVGNVFDMAARTGMDPKQTSEKEYIKSLEAVGKVADTLSRYKGDPALVSIISTYFKDHCSRGARSIVEVSERVAEKFTKYENVIKKFSGMDANTVSAMVYSLGNADPNTEGTVAKALNNHGGLIKKYRGRTARSVMLMLIDAEEKDPKIADAAANAVQKYGDLAADDVAKYISKALPTEAATNTIRAFTEHADIINKYKGSIIPTVVDAIGTAAMMPSFWNEANVTKTFAEQADVINKLEDSTAKMAVRIMESAGAMDPKCAAQVAATIDLYEGGSAVNVVSAFRQVWQGYTHSNQYKEPSAELYEKAASALTKHVDVIKKYEGDAQKGAAEAIAFSSINEKGNPDEAARALMEHESIIKRYEGKVAKLVAVHIGEAAAYGGQERGMRMAKAYTDYESSIKRHEGDNAFTAALLLAAPVIRNQDVKKVAAAIDKYEGEVAKNVMMALSNLSDAKPKMLIEASEAVMRLEDSEAFSKFQKEKLGMATAPYMFRKSYRFAGEGVVVETAEEENRALYEEGIKIIKGIKKGSIRLDPDVEFLHSELEGEKAKAVEMRKRIKESHGTDIEAAQFIEGYRKRKEELKKEDIVQIREHLQESYSTDKLKEELSQLAQHFMGGKPAKDAADIAKRLVVTGDEVKTDKIELSVLPRSMNIIPTYGEYRCCAFAGYRDDFVKLVEYKLNPAIELLQLKAGDKTAIAITAKTTSEDGQKVLLVDSFESGPHIFGSEIDPSKKVANTAMKLIMDYAKAEGFDEVLVSSETHNTTPQAFYNGIEGEKLTKPLRLKLDSEINEPYLEATIDLKTGSRIATGKLFRVEKKTATSS
jgi:hypothetical protein